MASNDSNLEGAVGGIDLNQLENFGHEPHEDQLSDDLIDIDKLKLEDEENW